MNAATTPLMIIRYRPRVGDGVTEFLHLKPDDQAELFSRHEHGGLRQLGPPDMPTILRDAKSAGIDRFVVDLSDVNWIDSTGVGMLVGWYQAAQAVGGTMVFAGAGETVLDLFKITKLDTVFTVFPTVSEAAACLRGATGDRTG
jgi:anti-sigma B factor antagonist